jgi:hypothetical protein
MGSNPQIVHETLARILEQARHWSDVRVDSRADVTQVLVRRGLLARFHPDGLVEIPFPRPVGEKLVAAGRAERHHALPDSGWVNVRFSEAADEPRVIEMLKLAYEARRQGAAFAGEDDSTKSGSRTERVVDESVEETFPASDPPASGRE